MLRSPQSRKHLYAYVAIAAGSLLLFVLTIFVADPTSITFSSKANEETRSLKIMQGASSSIDMPQNQLPECVERLSYVVEEDNTSCLVSIRCSDKEYKSIEKNCSVTDGTLSCYSQDACMEIDQWKVRAQEMCGC